MTARFRPLLAALALWATPTGGTVAPPRATLAEPSPQLRYVWRLEGLGGVLARLLPGVPASGTGVLTTEPGLDGSVRCEFRASSPQAAAQEYWSYQAEIDLPAARTLRVVDSLSFRGRHREKAVDLADQGVLDVLSGLHLLRVAPPEEELRTVLWSGRRVYPVLVTPHGPVHRVVGGRERELQLFSIQGRRDGSRRHWDSEALIWFSSDDPTTPVEILYRQQLGQLRLVLDDRQPAGP